MAGNITIEYDEQDIRNLILDDLARKMPGHDFESKDISIEVKSKQNYRSEWESADFRGTVKTYRSLLPK